MICNFHLMSRAVTLAFLKPLSATVSLQHTDHFLANETDAN